MNFEWKKEAPASKPAPLLSSDPHLIHPKSIIQNSKLNPPPEGLSRRHEGTKKEMNRQDAKSAKFQNSSIQNP
jgi:hypothetical protein